jgi:hypothetical protein
MSNDERRATAYHEAGHAVIGAIHGRQPTSIDIVHDAQGNAGHTLFADDLPPEFKRYFNQSPEKRRYLEMRVLITLAGTAAHDILFPGREHDEGDRRDECQAAKMIEESASWHQDHTAYLEAMKIKVRKQLKDRWPNVARVAEALLRQNYLSGAELAALMAPPLVF